MSFLNHPALGAYYSELARLKGFGYSIETQVRAPFRDLLKTLSQERNLLFVEEFPVGKNLRRKVDGAVQDGTFSFGFWEAKDQHDDLESEIKKKIAAGYPLSNIIFEDTQTAILWQNFKEAGRFDLSKPTEVADLLGQFFHYTEADREQVEVAVRDFLLRLPQLAGELLALVDKEHHDAKNPKFARAFDRFFLTCQSALNPNIKESAVKEMLVQHLLTERLFRVVFQNAEWVSRNVIAQEIESVIGALTAGAWSRAQFLSSLDPFYNVIEKRARDLSDFSAKQEFLNTVYERFFQGYSTETADTMGIVYTPQEIVDWMCQSVERVLQDEFGTTLATPGVKILDPCTGTGNFIVNVMRRIPSVDLPEKYGYTRKNADGSEDQIGDLFANEIMLLPYYVASGNIEHEYFERIGQYRPFEGLCFADTLDFSQSGQTNMFAEENTERIARQKAAEITVILGNPPYNVGQKNENDNNKNRAYKGQKGSPGVDDFIRDSYAKASKATLQNKLYDPYVRFFKWASKRLEGRDGVVCFVSNNSFLDQHAFDGMRQHLAEEFNHIWHLDLHGNVRRNPKLSGTTHNVFGIQVGVGITILAKNSADASRFIRYYRVPEAWRKSEKLAWLAQVADVQGVAWQELTPNAHNAWLTEGLQADFETFTPLGTKAAKASFSAESKTIFKTYSLGASTNRDEWVYDFDRVALEGKMLRFVEFYNAEVERWKMHRNKRDNFDNFVTYDDRQIKWSSTLKAAAKAGKRADLSAKYIRSSLYRPFCKQWLYYADVLIDRPALFRRILPKPNTQNRVICLSVPSHRAPFTALMTDAIPNLNMNSTDGFQCFPLYTYSADGSERFENVTSFGLQAARLAGGADVSREDVFYATYALLHHPQYRARYGENLKRELPRLPLGGGAGLTPTSNPAFALARLEEGVSPASWAALVRIGRALGELHVGYESVTPHPLAVQDTTTPGQKFSFRVEKMRFNADKSVLKVNDSISLSGFSPQMFDYKLGNRSALDWIVESYRVKSDERSGLSSDPNRPDEPRFILDLVGRVAAVSLETQRLIGALPPLFADNSEPQA